MEEIISVKIQGDGYLVNEILSVPKDIGNRHYQMILEWISNGNILQPEFTQDEINEQERQNKINEAKKYLSSTDYKFTSDYDNINGDVEQIAILRQQARDLIRSLEI